MRDDAARETRPMRKHAPTVYLHGDGNVGVGTAILDSSVGIPLPPPSRDLLCASRFRLLAFYTSLSSIHRAEFAANAHGPVPRRNKSRICFSVAHYVLQNLVPSDDLFYDNTRNNIILDGGVLGNPS